MLSQCFYSNLTPSRISHALERKIPALFQIAVGSGTDKTQVRELSRYLGISEKVAFKPSSPQLYPGHTATDEILFDDNGLDPIVVGLFDLKLSSEEISSATS